MRNIPNSIFLRLIYLSWILVAFVLFVAFGGTLISFMTILDTIPIIDTIEKLENEVIQGRLYLMVDRGSIYWDVIRVKYMTIYRRYLLEINYICKYCTIFFIFQERLLMLTKNAGSVDRMLIREKFETFGLEQIINFQEPVVLVHDRSWIEYYIKMILGDNQQTFYLPPNNEDATFFIDICGVAMAKMSPWKMGINHM